MNPEVESAPPAGAPAEIRRHSAYTRAIHWLLAAAFILAMATGLALYWASVLGWLIPFFGGKPTARSLHFWSGIAFAALGLLQLLDWARMARWTPADTEFLRRLREFAVDPDRPPPAGTGFFNGGQKLYFWAVAFSAGWFLLTGLVWWFRRDFPHPFYAFCRTSHRVLGVIMSALLLVHIYKAAIAEPGALRSMIRGTVSPDWARRRRPGWRWNGQ